MPRPKKPEAIIGELIYDKLMDNDENEQFNSEIVSDSTLYNDSGRIEFVIEECDNENLNGIYEVTVKKL
jgi:hypothetical protein